MTSLLTSCHIQHVSWHWRNRCQEDLNRFLLENWRRPPGRPRTIRAWRLSSKTWNPITSLWVKQLSWLRIVHFENWCLRLALRTHIAVHARKEEEKEEDYLYWLSDLLVGWSVWTDPKQFTVYFYFAVRLQTAVYIDCGCRELIQYVCLCTSLAGEVHKPRGVVILLTVAQSIECPVQRHVVSGPSTSPPLGGVVSL